MSEFVHTCNCGSKLKISEFQIGMEATCRNCKADVRYTEENCEPLPEPTPQMPKEPKAIDTSFAAVADTPTAPIDPSENQCVRCGKEFRGDWDRHSTIMGDLCNICANRNVDETPGTIGNPTESARAIRENAFGEDEENPYSAVPRPQVQSEPRGPWFMEKYPTESRMILALLAGGVILLAVWASFQENPSSSDTATTTSVERLAEAEADRATLEKKLEGLPIGIIFGLNYAFFLLGTFLPLYIVLTISNRMPYDSFLPNALEVALMSVLVALVGMLPFVGGILVLLGLLYLLFFRYEVSFFYAVLWAIIAPLTGIMLWSAKMMVFGLIANALR